jgi:hypothetical protein
MLLSAATLLGAAALARQDDERPPLPEGVEVLTRGPVHEAFAEPIAFDPEPGNFASKAPPELIQEMPPDQKPEGENVVWVPGYWAWDDERRDFLWISGIWRDMPPGRQWVPGYWEESDAGRFQWVNGYWIGAELEEAVYLPEPPASLEEGPSAPQPSQQHAWSPGYWYWVNEEYVWRPGYWFEGRLDWVWVPAHYVWTPAGCIFVEGYWDYGVAQRGLLFAPVYLTQPVIAQPQFVYTPTVVIRESVLVDHFWVRPNYGRYYFGDYYGPAYQEQGFAYWAEPGANPAGYDPIFVQRNFALQQQDPGWITGVREAYQLRVRDEGFRPPRTFVAQRQLLARQADAPSELLMAAPLAALAAGRIDAPRPRAGAAAVLARTEANRVRFERVDESRRTDLARRSTSLREFQRERRQREAQLSADFRGNRADRTRDAQVKAAQAERLEGAREKAAARAERSQDDRERARGKAQSARAVRLSRSPLTAQAAARRGPEGSPATPPPPPGPRPDRDGPDTPQANRPRPGGDRPDRPGLPKADRPDVPKAERRDLPKADRPDLPKAPPAGPARTERMRPPFPPPGVPDGPGRDRPKADRPGLLKADRPGAGRPDFPKADRSPSPKAEGRGLPKAARPDRPKAADVPGPARTERMRPPLTTPGAQAGPGRNRPGPFGRLRPGQDPSPGAGGPRPDGGPDRPDRVRPIPDPPRPGGFRNAQARPDSPKAQPRPGGPNRPMGPAGLTRPGGDESRPRLGNGPGPRPGGHPDRPKAQPRSDRPDPGDAQAKGKAQGKRQRQGND